MFSGNTSVNTFIKKKKTETKTVIIVVVQA